MHIAKVLIFVSTIMGCHGCFEKDKLQRTQKNNVSFTEENARPDPGNSIPLDSVGSQESYVLEKVDVQGAEGVTFSGMEGLPEQFAFVPDSRRLNLNADDLGTEGFIDYNIISELSPKGAQANPAARVYNLPELLERLQLESPSRFTGKSYTGGLPNGINLRSSSDTSLTVIITEPTVLSASFSTSRTLRIINRSKLVLLVPLADGIILQQERAALKDLPSTQIFSHTCLFVDSHNFEGTVEYNRLGEVTLGGIESCSALLQSQDTRIISKSAPKMSLEKWMPQVLITQMLRNETIVATAKRWSPLFRISALQFL